jgi:pimeloyl-ACP methyl ester carboxylesterase
VNDPESRVVDVDGIPMSALMCEVPEPRAVIVALHGGGVMSRYFDAPGQPRNSLLRTSASLGYTVIALDRPGYGGSGTLDSPEDRAGLACAAIDLLLAGRPRGAGVFVTAHSAGCMMAVRMAASERGGSLLGLELAGTGLHHHPHVLTAFDERRAGRKPIHEIIWHPESLYPEGSVRDHRILSAGVLYEMTEGRRWRKTFPELAARVRVPVRYSLGDHERVWRAGPAALAEVAALFTAAPRVVTYEQAHGGHNLSLGLSARAYHLSVLSFAEECVLEHIVAGSASSQGEQEETA